MLRSKVRRRSGARRRCARRPRPARLPPPPPPPPPPAPSPARAYPHATAVLTTPRGGHPRHQPVHAHVVDVGNVAGRGRDGAETILSADRQAQREGPAA